MLNSKITKIPINRLKRHPLDPFLPYSEDKLVEMSVSIARYGLFEPIIVTPCPGANDYFILSGKNRAAAVGLIEKATDISAFVMDADENTAVMIITDSNLKHRDRLLPSERGYAYRLQYEALKRQGRRNDLDLSGLSGQKLNSWKQIAEHNAVSESVIKRYVRLTLLVPEILALVDNETLGLYAGVELSFLDEVSQNAVFGVFLNEIFLGVDYLRGVELRQLYKEYGTLTEALIKEKVLPVRDYGVRVLPLINRKMLKNIFTEEELPDDECLISLFADFLREKFFADGSISVTAKRVLRYL
jgi:ParB family chromosome partitioning protein